VTAAAILDGLSSMAVWACPRRRRFHLHLVSDHRALDRVEHRLPVGQRQAHVLREEWRGLARDGRHVLSMQDLTGESALELG
jgi:hypothetical protein